MQEVAEETEVALTVSGKPKARGAFLLELNRQLVDCAQRAIRLLETPEAIPTLYPGIVSSWESEELDERPHALFLTAARKSLGSC